MADSWEAFESEDLPEALATADKLFSAADPPEEPYKSKYAAAETLDACHKRLEAFLSSKDPAQQAATERAAAVLDCKAGLALLDTDMLSQGEGKVSSALAVLEKDKAAHPLLLQEAYNSLGVLWSNRDDHKRAEELLLEADSLFQQYLSLPTDASDLPADLDVEHLARPTHKCLGKDSTICQDTIDAVAEHGITPVQLDEAQRRPADKAHLQTLFYLAQVYGHMSQEDKSADYCGATLRAQLGQDGLDATDWVSNATQLASYYMGKGEFAVAEFVLRAADAVAGQAQSRGEAVDGEAGAKLAQGWAGLFLQRLAASRAEKDCTPLAPGKLKDVPDNIRFGLPGLPSTEELPFGVRALVRDVEGAKGLFNAAMRHFKATLEYFQLDGYVTEHCNILMQISALYSSLAEFEPDNHTRCVLHKQRCKRLEPVMQQLNPEAFPGLVWSMRLEVANAYKEIMELKHEAARPFPKVLAAAQDAKEHYDRFLQDFSKDGELPDRVPDTENEGPFINACFSRARVAHRMQPPPGQRPLGDVRMLLESVRYYQYIVDYIARNKLEAHKPQAALCSEMVELLNDHVKMIRSQEEKD